MNITIEAMADAMVAGSEPFRDALVRVVADHRAMVQTLTATQQRCTDLLERARKAEAERDAAKRDLVEVDLACRRALGPECPSDTLGAVEAVIADAQSSLRRQYDEQGAQLVDAKNSLGAIVQFCHDKLGADCPSDPVRAVAAMMFNAATRAGRDTAGKDADRIRAELDEANKQIEKQRRQLTIAQQNNHKRNVQLDALRFVWCTGGCEGGMARWSGETITEEIVSEAVRNTQRMVSWYLNHRSRNGADRSELDGLGEKWRLSTASIGPQLSAAIAAYRAEPTPRACRMLDEFGYLRAKAVLDAVVAGGGAEERGGAEPSGTTLREQVIAFHRAMGQPVLDRPQVPSEERVRLRLRLNTEEHFELLRACGLDTVDVRVAELRVMRAIDAEPLNVDLVKATDALGDIDFVSEGFRAECGINGKPIADEVARSNMSKLGSEVRPDGKVTKGPNYSPPDIAGKLREQGWEG